MLQCAWGLLTSAFVGLSRVHALQEPLLADGALTWRDPAAGGSSGVAPVPGWGRPPLPPSTARAIASRGGGHATTMARSLRLFPGALSPHSMASGVGFGSGFDR